MKKIFTLFLSLFALACFAQNFACNTGLLIDNPDTSDCVIIQHGASQAHTTLGNILAIAPITAPTFNSGMTANDPINFTNIPDICDTCGGREALIGGPAAPIPNRIYQGCSACDSIKHLYQKFWGLNGNAIIAGNQFIGTINNTSMLFFSNNLYRMRLDSTGFLAIGTGLPFPITGTKLQVGGSGSQFTVDGSGNIDLIHGVVTNWPASQGAANTFLINDGSGNLNWAYPTDSLIYINASGLTHDSITAQIGMTYFLDSLASGDTLYVVFPTTAKNGVSFNLRLSSAVHPTSPGSISHIIYQNGGFDGVDIGNTGAVQMSEKKYRYCTATGKWN